MVHKEWGEKKLRKTGLWKHRCWQGGWMKEYRGQRWIVRWMGCVNIKVKAGWSSIWRKNMKQIWIQLNQNKKKRNCVEYIQFPSTLYTHQIKSNSQILQFWIFLIQKGIRLVSYCIWLYYDRRIYNMVFSETILVYKKTMCQLCKQL